MALNTFIMGYRFTITSASATVGATYTNNGQTFTVLATIASQTTLICSGTGAPAASGTLTKTAGTGSATITFSAVVTNANWGSTQNWTQGTVPTSTDTHTTTFDATSPACTVDTSNRACYILDMSAYVNTITMTFGIEVYGSITLGSGMTMSGGGALQSYTPTTAITLTSNGCYVPYLILSGVGAHTKTFADNWDVGILEGGITSTTLILTLNGFKILVRDNWSLGATARLVAGTTTIELSGGGATAWGGTSAVQSVWSNPIIINKSAGTLTFGAFITVGSGTLTYTAGTVDASTNLSQFRCLSNKTYDLGSAVTFYTMNMGGVVTIGANHLYVSNLFNVAASVSFAGAGKLNSDWSVTNLQLSVGTLTLSANWTCVNYIGVNTSVGTLNGFALSISGNLSAGGASGVNVGTTNLILVGTGTVGSNGNVPAEFRNNITINTAGTITFNEYFVYNTGILTYTSGTVDTLTNASKLIIQAGTTFNTGALVWNNIYFVGSLPTAAIYTINSLLLARKIFITYYSISFQGTYGFTCDDLITQDAYYLESALQSTSLKLLYTNTYTINNFIGNYSTTINHRLIESSHASNKVPVVFNGSSQEIINCDFTRVNASGGNKLWTLNGVVSNSDNVGVSTSSIVPITVSSIS